MLVSELRLLAEESKNNPNYQHKDLLPKDFQIEASKSLLRLGDKASLAYNKWEAVCKLESVETSLQEYARLRFLAQTNLFFLCKLLEKYNKVTIDTHEDICNKFFVPKNPTINTFEEFANAFSGLKERMLLVPRGGFKSSIDMADCVQWVICFPDVTILILTGVYPLACDFVSEIRGHFLLEDVTPIGSKEKKHEIRKWQNGTYSLFQALFFEHCTADVGKETEFQTPAVPFGDKETTITAAGIEQSLSGWHFGIMKLDDVVTNENSLTITRLASVNRQISINKAMLHPFGFLDFIGTWYDEGDIYGLTITAEDELSRELGRLDAITGSIDSGRYNSSVNIEIYLRAAWWPTDEAAKQGKIEAEMTKEDWELWFPERLPYEFLKKESKDKEGFAIKYLNNPRKVHQVKFQRELLLRRTIPATQLPNQGLIVTTIDTAYSIKSWADYTAIITSIIFGGKFYIIDVARGRFNEYELPAKIAAVGNQWKPKRIIIEDSTGVRWMRNEICREMDKYRISIPLEFVPLGQGNKTKAKEIKAKPVLRLLGDERMFFSNSSQGLEELYTELEKFGTVSGLHDDIVDALSLLADQLGAYADMESRLSIAQSDFVSDRKAKEHHDMIYGLGQYRDNSISDHPVTNYELQHGSDSSLDRDPFDGLI